MYKEWMLTVPLDLDELVININIENIDKEKLNV